MIVLGTIGAVSLASYCGGVACGVALTGVLGGVAYGIYQLIA